MNDKLKKMLSDSDYRFMVLTNLGLMNILPDKTYLKLRYKKAFGKSLNLTEPKTYNEKLQWLKLNDRKPLYTTMVDKFSAKAYVSEIIGEEHIIPLLGVWDRFDDINFDELPNQFVLKCTHDSGSVFVCKDKSTIDLSVARRIINNALETNYYSLGREWPYKNVTPRIIAEQYLEDADTPGGLTDYKIHCFNGSPQLIQVITDRFSKNGMKNDHYDLRWEKLDITRDHYAVSETPLPKPAELEELLDYSRRLSKDTYYVRVDFYMVANRIYFGEMTFYPASGFGPFHPEKWDHLLGEWIKLPIDRQEKNHNFCL